MSQNKITNNSVHFNSIQFLGYLLACRLRSTNARYKPRTKTQIPHQNSTNSKNKKLNKINKNKMAGK
jgi:hypothetical protein